MINLKTRQRDYETTLDICKDKENGLTVGVNTSSTEYVAQVTIPAREYEVVETEKHSPSTMKNGNISSVPPVIMSEYFILGTPTIMDGIPISS